MPKTLTAALTVVALLLVAGPVVAHGKHDEKKAGTIAAYDDASGKLEIALDDGDTVAGYVTERTKIHCRGDKPKPPKPHEHPRGKKAHKHGPDHCGTEALKPGRDVEKADLTLRDGKAVFKHIDLG